MTVTGTVNSYPFAANVAIDASKATDLDCNAVQLTPCGPANP